MTVLAVDQGTSGTKAVVVDDAGRVVASAERPVHPLHLPGSAVEVDPAELLDSVLSAAGEAIRVSGLAPSVLALANQGETVLAWDRASGRPLSPAVVWQDRRSQTVCDAMVADADRLAAITGLRLDPYFSAPKMAWIRREMAGGGVVTTSDTWLLHELCGAFVTDVSTASRSMLLDLASRTWSDECLSAFGLDSEPLPEVVACDTVVGSTDRFGHPMQVGGLIVDQSAALLAQGCTEAGTAKCTFGTGAFMLTNVGSSPVASTSGLTTSVAWQVGGDVRYYMDGQVYAAGSAIRWLCETGLLSEPAHLDAEAAADAGGVVCVPSLAGLASPWWRPDATATLAGLTLASTAGQMVAAVLEGIAAQVAEVVDSVAADLGRPVETLRVDGGLTRSRRLMQAVADVARIPVVVAADEHATAAGAAILGRAALGDDGPYRSAATPPPSAVGFEPSWSADRSAAFRARWSELAGRP
jgi:glycerol kinase